MNARFNTTRDTLTFYVAIPAAAEPDTHTHPQFDADRLQHHLSKQCDGAVTVPVIDMQECFDD